MATVLDGFQTMLSHEPAASFDAERCGAPFSAQRSPAQKSRLRFKRRAWHAGARWASWVSFTSWSPPSTLACFPPPDERHLATAQFTELLSTELATDLTDEQHMSSSYLATGLVPDMHLLAAGQVPDTYLPKEFVSIDTVHHDDLQVLDPPSALGRLAGISEHRAEGVQQGFALDMHLQAADKVSGDLHHDDLLVLDPPSALGRLAGIPEHRAEGVQQEFALDMHLPPADKVFGDLRRHEGLRVLPVDAAYSSNGCSFAAVRGNGCLRATTCPISPRLHWRPRRVRRAQAPSGIGFSHFVDDDIELPAAPAPVCFEFLALDEIGPLSAVSRHHQHLVRAEIERFIFAALS